MAKKAAQAAKAEEPTDQSVGAQESGEETVAAPKKSGVRYAVYQLHQGSFNVESLRFERGRVYQISPELAQNIGKAKPAVPVQVFDSAEEAAANRAALEAKWNPKPKAA